MTEMEDSGVLRTCRTTLVIMGYLILEGEIYEFRGSSY